MCACWCVCVCVPGCVCLRVPGCVCVCACVPSECKNSRVRALMWVCACVRACACARVSVCASPHCASEPTRQISAGARVRRTHQGGIGTCARVTEEGTYSWDDASQSWNSRPTFGRSDVRIGQHEEAAVCVGARACVCQRVSACVRASVCVRACVSERVIARVSE